MKQVEEIKDKLNSLANELGFELVELTSLRLGGRTVIRAYIYKPGGVTISDCKNVSRAYSEYLDIEDVIRSRYSLEVSSLGLDKPLLEPKDFERRLSETICLELKPDDNNNLNIEGKLIKTDDTGVTIENDDKEIHIEYNRIIMGKIIY